MILFLTDLTNKGISGLHTESENIYLHNLTNTTSVILLSLFILAMMPQTCLSPHGHQTLIPIRSPASQHSLSCLFPFRSSAPLQIYQPGFPSHSPDCQVPECESFMSCTFGTLCLTSCFFLHTCLLEKLLFSTVDPADHPHLGLPSSLDGSSGCYRCLG